MVRLVAAGRTYKAAGAEMGIGWTTVRTHINRALRRLDVPNQAQAVIVCWQRGWLDEEPNHDPELTPQARAYLEAWLEDLRNPSAKSFLRRREALKVMLRTPRTERIAGRSQAPRDQRGGVPGTA